MRAGALNKRVIIERKTDARGTYGEPVATWATLLTVWAGIKPVSGNEQVQGGQLDATATHSITMRHTDILSTDRINFGGRIFNIVSVLDQEERGRELKIMAIEDV